MNPDVYDVAAKILERDGWVCGEIQAENGSVCLVGAIHKAVLETGGAMPTQRTEYSALLAPVVETLHPGAPGFGDDPGVMQWRLTSWNDYAAQPGRPEAILRATAERLRELGDDPGDR